MSTHMHTALASRLLRIAFAVSLLTACAGCKLGPWQVPGDTTVLVGQDEYASMYGVNVILLSVYTATPLWKTSDGRRTINGRRVMRATSRLADQYGIEREKETFALAEDRVLAPAFWRHPLHDSSVQSYNKTVVIFSLDPLAGVVIPRPIVETGSWVHGKPSDRADAISVGCGMRVLPDGVFVSTDFGPYRPEAWFIDGMPGPARPFDETGDSVTISHAGYAYLIKLDGDRWVVERASEAGS